MGRKTRQLFNIFISVVVTIIVSILWIYLNKKGFINNILFDSDIKTMIFNKGLGIVVVMGFIYTLGAIITFLTGIRLRIFGG